MHSRKALWDQDCSLDQDRELTAAKKRGKSRQGGPREEIHLPSVHMPLRAPPSGGSSGEGRVLGAAPVMKPEGNDRNSSSGQEEDLGRKSKVRGQHPREALASAANTNTGSSLLPLIGHDPVLPFSRGPSESQCKHCGSLVASKSISRHEGWCSRFKSNPKSSATTGKLRHQDPGPGQVQGKIVARVVTMGLAPGYIDQVFFTANGRELDRPTTRTLPRSSLQETGHGLPSASVCGDEGSCNSQGVQQCRNCGRIVATDKLKVHYRMCQSEVPHISTKNVGLSSPQRTLRVAHQQVAHHQSGIHKAQRPRTVVCYICGREYGSKSIAIHEPQCLKKFNVQNNKLPIKDRLPLPKKKSAVAIVRQLSRDEVVVMPRGLSAPGSVEQEEEDMAQRFFDNCYSEFERELVPCKRCGRTFAPERHVLHEPKCNAKPLRKSQS